ncbi:hypothetical protein [Scleromatobacter humisilvae]|uniref:Uncharacterized protein n=1 Tax=Scleromatobacter humisilvae TaxID=2897159 RepID=A0A9X1YIS2_9BURK|nr:hypothetical protein [Scleromatobacter humisilvae]MCK9687264.1 hypothetical protein [Scleromatobacter humisilvae]
MKTVDWTNDYRINRALTAAVEVAVAVGKSLMTGLAILILLTGVKTFRGAAWVLGGAVIFISAVVAVVL